MRNTTFSLIKALAIILVVISHSGAPSWLTHFVYQFHVPVFFICAGFFFKLENLDNENTFIKKHITRLYFPFVRWSIFFLIIHNLLYPIGLLSETYGNAAGGVIHPYSWQQFNQNLWSIVCNMSGYDAFLAGAFWFFRTLFLSLIAFLILLKLMRRASPNPTPWKMGGAVLAIALILALWHTLLNLNLTGVAQNGYRELMALIFLSIGFLFKQYESRLQISWKHALGALLFLVLGSIYFPQSMMQRGTFLNWLTLPLLGTAGFVLLYWLCTAWCKRHHRLTSFFASIGDHTLYIFAFHLLAFKLISALKVWHYDLPWEMVGCHTVVNTPNIPDAYWLLYTLVGVLLPYAWIIAYRKLEYHWGFRLAYGQFFNLRVFKTSTKVILRGFGLLLTVIYKLIRVLILSIINSIKGILTDIKSIINASNPSEE